LDDEPQAEPIASENARRGLRPSSVVRGSVHRTDTYLTAADRPLTLVAPERGAGPTRSDETTAGPSSSSMVTRSAPNRKRLSSTGTVKARPDHRLGLTKKLLGSWQDIGLWWRIARA
jgi:hypothetical protein